MLDSRAHDRRVIRPYDLIEANLRLSSQRCTLRHSSERRLAPGRPSTTSQSPNQDSPKASVNVPLVVLPSLSAPDSLSSAYAVDIGGSLAYMRIRVAVPPTADIIRCPQY